MSEEAVFFSWAFEPLPAFGLLLAAVLYWRGWDRLRRPVPHRFPAWRLQAFLAGLAFLYAAVASPLDAFASFWLSAHMVQHLILTMVAPPLLLLGAPQLPLLAGLPRGWAREGVGPFLHWKPLQDAGHFLTHPVTAWILFILSNLAWHVPAAYELALRSPAWHDFEHLCFLGTALLFWWPVVQPWPSRAVWPRWAMIPYLLLADLQNTALAAFLSFYERVLYPTYANAPRLGGGNPLTDQAAAGAIMWVPGSLAFLIPAGVIAVQFLSPKREVRSQKSEAGGQLVFRSAFDLLRLPFLGPLLRGKYFRRSVQIVMFALAAVIVLDGLLGPEVSAMNLAGVLPWTHWRALTVIALLAVGNLFCMACPFTFVRDLGRRLLPANRSWPRFLRSKWLAVALLVMYLWAYEAFDLWDKPAVTAWIILGYFLAALIVDGFFRGASFCKYVCPIGQFHFVQSLASPFEIKVRRPDVCASCRTYDCIKGNEAQRGCELKLFQPRKQGNMDCTFCLDCIKACPHDNVGIIAVPPGRDLADDRVRSSVGRYARRVDLAALVLVLAFGAFANAAGMVVPVLRGLAGLCARLGLSELPVTGLLAVIALVILPAGLASFSAALSRPFTTATWRENFCRFSIALGPLGFGMWLAHFVFHFFTAAFTPWPVVQRAGRDLGLTLAEPQWRVSSLAFSGLPALELLLLDLGLLLSLYVLWRIARQLGVRPFLAVLPWGLLAVLLYAAGVWIIFQPMEMRGTLLH